MKKFRALALLLALTLAQAAEAGHPFVHSHHLKRHEGRGKTDGNLSFLLKNFRNLSPAAQVATVQTLRDFLGNWEASRSSSSSAVLKDFSRRWVSLFWGEAEAEGTFDCLYGGWASRQIGGKCSSPRSNPLYQKLFKESGCAEGGFLCSPAMFGPDLCLQAVDQGTPELVKATYQSCKAKFTSEHRKIEDVVKRLSTDAEAYATLQQTAEVVARACYSDKKHFQYATDMCSSANVRFNAIVAEFRRDFPDHFAANKCYHYLDDAKKCGVLAPASLGADAPISRDWEKGRWGCGYFDSFDGDTFVGIEAFRDPDSSGGVYVRAPDKEWFQGKNFPLAPSYLYKMSGATFLDGTKDVTQLAGTKPGDVAKLDFFDHPATYAEADRATVYEIREQMQERRAEYLVSTAKGPNGELKQSLSRAVHECAGVKDADFQKEEAETCKVLGLSDGCSESSTPVVPGLSQGVPGD